MGRLYSDEVCETAFLAFFAFAVGILGGFGGISTPCEEVESIHGSYLKKGRDGDGGYFMKGGDDVEEIKVESKLEKAKREAREEIEMRVSQLKSVKKVEKRD